MSNYEKMTIHKALCELKVIGERINKALNAVPFVVPNEHGNKKIKGVPVEECVAQIKSSYQSAMDLINRREAIKRAVVKSNAVTIVKIGEKEYTVAEAIDMKNNGMDYIKVLRRKLVDEVQMAKRNADMANGRNLEDRADGYIKNLYGSTDMKNLAEEAIEAREAFIKQHTTELVDPLDAVKLSMDLEAQFYDFMSEVDAALSVSNAITEIEITY